MAGITRRALGKRLLGPIGKAAKELGTSYESDPTPQKQKRYHKWLKIGRRTFLGGAIVGTGAYILERKTGVISQLYDDFLNHFFVPHVEGPIAQNLMDKFLNDVPTPDTLLQDFPQDVLNREIVFTPENVRNVHWYVFGDSMNLLHGRRTRGAETNPLGQVGSYPYEMAKRVANPNVKQWTWEGKNFAIPGAESGNGRDANGNVVDQVGIANNLLGARQLGGDALAELTNDPSAVSVILSLNGNDWRNIVPSKRKVDMYLDWIQHPEKLDQGKINEIKGLIDEHNATVDTFGKNLRLALDKLTQANFARRQNGYPPIEVTFVLPLNNRVVEHVPFQPKDDAGSASGGYFVGNNNPSNEPTNLQKVLYHITMAIMGETADAIDDNRSKYKNDALSFHAISKFGLETSNLYIDVDGDSEGHLNQNGQDEVANRLFGIVQDTTQPGTVNLSQEPGIIIDYPRRQPLQGLRRLPN